MALYPQFVLFGDSLLEQSAHLLDGFSLAAQLQSRYIRRLDVVNRGLSGYNTSQALHVIHKLFPQPYGAHIEFSLILFGANDACIPGGETKQHVPLQEYKRNIKTIIKHLSEVSCQPKIILATPPPIDEGRQEEIAVSKGQSLCRKASITAQYAEAVREIASESGDNVVLLDLWSVLMKEAVKHTSVDDHPDHMLGAKELGSNKVLTELLPDGLHLGSIGYAKFYESLISVIESKWPNSLGSYVLPEWRRAPKLE